MNVEFERLFTIALGRVPPCEADKVELDSAHRCIEFEACRTAKVLACAHSGAAVRCSHDRRRCSWRRHLELLRFEARQHADVPRVARTSYGRTPHAVVSPGSAQQQTDVLRLRTEGPRRGTRERVRHARMDMSAASAKGVGVALSAWRAANLKMVEALRHA